jgi:pyridoxal phosphate enzyme (YggS family)
VERVDRLSMNNITTRVAENVQRACERIAQAAQAAGRSVNDVSLIAVTKYGGIAEIEAVLAAGCQSLGESRPQALWDKAATLAQAEPTPQGVEWHLIGHLQRNKVRRTLPIVSLIHSVDSLRLLQAIDQAGAELDRKTPILLEVNTSGDREKHGWAAEDLRRLAPTLDDFPHVQVRGLMTMASRTGDERVARQNFADLRTLRDELAEQCPDSVDLAELSMGMSGDFEIAIECGATWVRVGNALFGSRES